MLARASELKKKVIRFFLAERSNSCARDRREGYRGLFFSFFFFSVPQFQPNASARIFNAYRAATRRGGESLGERNSGYLPEIVYIYI